MKGLNKTLRGLKSNEAKEKRAVYDEIISWQPQYLGQKPYVPFYFSKFSKREGGECFEDYIRFNVTDSDRLIFPELNGVREVKLRTGNGRVSEVK